MQKCKSKPRARDPTTGQHHLWCSECQNFIARFATPGTLQTGVIIGRGRKPSTGTEMNANTESNPAPLLCDVSMDVLIPLAKSLNGLSFPSIARKSRDTATVPLCTYIAAGRVRTSQRVGHPRMGTHLFQQAPPRPGIPGSLL